MSLPIKVNEYPKDNFQQKLELDTEEKKHCENCLKELVSPETIVNSPRVIICENCGYALDEYGYLWQ